MPLEPWPSDASRRSPAASEERPTSSPLAGCWPRERTEQLESLLGQLSDVQADALRLRFFGGLKFQEIAETMQCSLNTAKNRVRWGLMRMAELLQAADARERATATVSEEREA